jgi:hypothetical protein
LFPLDEVASAIGGGYVGLNKYAQASNYGMYCDVNPQSDDSSTMVQSPVYHTQPDIVDVHLYPQVTGTGTTDTYVQSEAEQDFTELTNFLRLTSLQSALIMIGETHSGTQYHGNSGTAPCAGNPDSAANSTVAGFKLSQLAQPPYYSLVFRPWMELAAPTGLCYPYNGGLHNSYQNVNFNNNGPYTPAQQ